MSRLIRRLAYINIVALAINAIMVWLMLVKSFPPILGIAIFLACLAGVVWFSCYVNDKLPECSKRTTFYSAPTERMESL